MLCSKLKVEAYEVYQLMSQSLQLWRRNMAKNVSIYEGHFNTAREQVEKATPICVLFDLMNA